MKAVSHIRHFIPYPEFFIWTSLNFYKSVKQKTIMNTKNSTKKNSVRKKRIAIIQSHGTAYFIDNKTLAGYPLLKTGKPDKESPFFVEEAPKSYMDNHIKALKLLGVKRSDIPGYLKKIEYYDE